MEENILTADEKLYVSLAPNITDNSDPLDSVINDSVKKEQNLQRNLDDTNNQLDSLVTRTKPMQPKPIAKIVTLWSVVITIVVAFLSLIFHGVVSLFKLFAKIPWNTWHVFLYAFVGCLAITLLLSLICMIIDFWRKRQYTKDLMAYNNYVVKSKILHNHKDAQERELALIKEDLGRQFQIRYHVLGYALNKVIGLPFPSEEIKKDNYADLKIKYIGMHKLQEEIKKATDDKEKRTLLMQLTDKKLEFFYTQSMKAEITPDVYQEFARQYNIGKANAMLLRRDIPVNDSKGTLELYQLNNYKKSLKENILSKVIDKFYEVSKRKTGKKWLPFITDKNKKEQQLQDLKHLVDIAKEQYEDIKKINRHIAYALEYVRGFAYRNIYLGAELINYLRGTTGGGSLDKVNDTTSVKDVDNESDSLSADSIELRQNAPSNAEELLNLVANNPVFMVKATASVSFSNGVSSVALISEIVDNYVNSQNAEKDDKQLQKQLTDSIQTISDGYNDALGSLLRALEIIEAIINANEGFMTIYGPLSENVFINGNTNTQALKMDIIGLAQAVNKYKVIADSKIN